MCVNCQSLNCAGGNKAMYDQLVILIRDLPWAFYASLDGNSVWDGTGHAPHLSHQASVHLIFRAAGHQNPVEVQS